MGARRYPLLACALALGVGLAAGCASRGDVAKAKQAATKAAAASKSEVQAFQQSAEAAQGAALDASEARHRSVQSVLTDSRAARRAADKTAHSLEILQDDTSEPGAAAPAAQ